MWPRPMKICGSTTTARKTACCPRFCSTRKTNGCSTKAATTASKGLGLGIENGNRCSIHYHQADFHADGSHPHPAAAHPGPRLHAHRETHRRRLGRTTLNGGLEPGESAPWHV